MATTSTPLSTQYAIMHEAEVVQPASAARRNSTNTSSKPKKRVRNFTATDRAAHRVFEKSRREAFKKRLVQLAGFIPALADTNEKQLSKHIVVDKSIERHKLQQARCSTAVITIHALMQERDELIAEVNEWRRQCGHSEMKTARPLDSTVDELLESGQEVFRDLPVRNEEIDISMKQARELDEHGDGHLDSDGEGGGLLQGSQDSSPPNSNENGSLRNQTQSSPEQHGTSPEDISSGLPRLTGDMRLHSWTGDMQPIHSPIADEYRPSSAGLQLPNFVPDGPFPQFPMNGMDGPNQPFMPPQDHHDHHPMTFHEGSNPFHPDQPVLPFSPTQFLPVDEQEHTWLPWDTQNQDPFANYMPSQEVSKF